MNQQINQENLVSEHCTLTTLINHANSKFPLFVQLIQ